MEEKTKKQFELPKGWVETKLGNLVIDPKSDFVDGPFGSNLKANEYRDEGIPVFKIQNIKAGYFVDKNIVYVTEQKAEELSRHTFQLGDLIVTKLGDPLGLCCQVPTKYPFGVIVADLIRIRPSNVIIKTDFLMYLINSEIVQSQFKEFTKGTTRPRVNLTIVRDIDVPLPPVAEQERLVAKVEELLSELDAGIKSLKTAQFQLKIYRQAVLKWAFEGKLTNENLNDGELPKEWKLVNLGTVLSFVGSGVTPKGGQSVYQTSGVIFIRSQNVYPNQLRLDDVAYISDEIDERMKRTRVIARDVLLNITGASIGRCAFVPDHFLRANVNQHVCILRPEQDLLLSHYLSNYLNSPKAQKDIMNTQSGATRQGLNFQQVRNLVVPLCSLDEQQLIVEEIESRLSVCDKLEETITTSLKQSEALRQSILKKAFEGKLVAQYENDESATILLEKIKKEREKFFKEEKIRKQNTPRISKSKYMAEELKEILQLLEEKGEPILAHTLWQSSIYKEDIDGFYAEIKKLIDKRKIKEMPREGQESYLALAATK